jgi:hypothetical protein
VKKIHLIALVLSTVILTIPLFAGERTIPVDIFLMVDKSLSMAEQGKYDSLHAWVKEQLLGQILINGDWITIYQFYGKADRLMTLTVENQADRNKIVSIIDTIKPNGQYTDIGLALDTIKEALSKRGTNGRHKIMLLLTDLKQEAPWTSKYAGTPEKFDSPYLAEARSVEHDGWYEITLDMDIQDQVVKTSKELYSSIQENGNENAPRTTPLESEGLSSNGKAIANDTTIPENQADKATSDKKATQGFADAIGSLPFTPLIVVISCIVMACLVGIPIALRSRKEKDRQKKANSANI